jgi:hypothetical protein
MSHVITLWAKGTAAAVDAPLLAFLILLAVAFSLAAIVTLLEIRREARQSRLTTAAALRQDAFTAERRRRLHLVQHRSGR